MAWIRQVEVSSHSTSTHSAELFSVKTDPDPRALIPLSSIERPDYHDHNHSSHGFHTSESCVWNLEVDYFLTTFSTTTVATMLPEAVPARLGRCSSSRGLGIVLVKSFSYPVSHVSSDIQGVEKGGRELLVWLGLKECLTALNPLPRGCALPWNSNQLLGRG